MASFVDIEVDQGVSKTILFQWFDGSTNLPVDMTGFSALMQIRKAYGDPVVLLELSTTNNKLDLSGGTGTVVIVLAPSDTATMQDYSCVYELVLTRPDNTKLSFLKGKFTLLQNVVS
jgi:hypothetical protein